MFPQVRWSARAKANSALLMATKVMEICFLQQPHGASLRASHLAAQNITPEQITKADKESLWPYFSIM